MLQIPELNSKQWHFCSHLHKNWRNCGCPSGRNIGESV